MNVANTKGSDEVQKSADKEEELVRNTNVGTGLNNIPGEKVVSPANFAPGSFKTKKKKKKSKKQKQKSSKVAYYFGINGSLANIVVGTIEP